MNELISVIVPVYNVETYLEQCVNSIRAQTYSNLEIILVNDGSKDNSGRICDRLAQEDGRIHVIHKENGGVSSARNAGLDYAHGEYIAFVDGDDYIDETMYEKLLGKMEEDTDIVFCYLQSFYPDGRIYSCIDEGLKEAIKTPWDIRPLIPWVAALKDWNGGNVKGVNVSSCLSLMRKSNLEELSLHFIEGIKMGEDRLFMMHYLSESNRCALVEEPLYYYRKGVTSSATANLCKVYLDFEHEKRRYLLKKDVVEKNKYYTQEQKDFLILHLGHEFYFNFAHTQILHNPNYKLALPAFCKDELVKQIEKTLTIKKLRETGYSIKRIIFLKLSTHKLWSICKFLKNKEGKKQ